MRFLILFTFLITKGLANELPDLKNLVVHKIPKTYDNVIFLDDAGEEINIQNLDSKVIILNFWATWCEPCKEEMPSLELLQSQFNEDEFLVLPINLDRGPKKKAINFFKDQNISNLDIYFDDKNEIPREVKILGLPVSIFISKDGKEISRLIGPAKWDDEYFVEYIKENLF